MNKTKQALARRIAPGALVAVLMCGVAAPALAAADPRDAKIEALQQQLNDMNAELARLRSSGSVSSDRLDAMQAQMNAFGQALAELKSQSDSAAADIATLKVVPPASVTTTLANARPTFQTADKRFSASIRGVAMFDATHYFQDAANPNLSVDMRRGAGSADTARARDLNSGTNFRRARFGLEGKAFEFFDYGFIFEYGGSGAEDASLGRITGPGFDENGIVDAVEKVTDVYLGVRREGERFLDTYRRIGMEPFKEALYG